MPETTVDIEYNSCFRDDSDTFACLEISVKGKTVVSISKYNVTTYVENEDGTTDEHITWLKSK
jgi:hypothetical protein